MNEENAMTVEGKSSSIAIAPENPSKTPFNGIEEDSKASITLENKTPSIAFKAATPVRRGRPPKNQETKVVDRTLKIIVYAISKNESKFVKRWTDSMKEADGIFVLDTGSSDNTVALLKECGAKVEQKRFVPWRFDTSRNESIDLAVKAFPDADLLVCTDLDEYFLPGWREKIEKAWISACEETKKKGMAEPTTIQYEYIWNFNADGSDATKFWYEKIHSVKAGARWTHPVHEILSYQNGKKTLVRVPGVRLEHHADPTKSRGQYLSLLEMSVNEAPNDDRNMHYLGREYMFRGRWDEAIETLKRHLALPSAKWLAERGNSMRFIARCYGEKGDAANQEIWLWRAIIESVNQREACLDLAELLHKKRDWVELLRVCELMLSRKEKVMSYITKAEAWGFRPYDLYAVALWYNHRPVEALTALEEALKLAPDNDRLKKNREVMKNFPVEQKPS